MVIVNPMFNVNYNGSKGCELDRTKCELYDDLPYVSLKERVAKAVASGQLLDDYRYLSVHSDITDKIDDIDKLQTPLDDTDYACDLITKYKDIRDRRIARQREYFARSSANQNVVKKADTPEPPKSDGK